MRLWPLLALAFLPSLLPAQGRIPCRVSAVHDGDTFRCAAGFRVRLILIDAPELDQAPYGPASQRALNSLVGGRTVWLSGDVQSTDRYGRTLAYVWASDTSAVSVNVQMVAAGYALVAVYPPNVAQVDAVRAAADRARRGRLGLWAVDAFSCLPSDHRKGVC